MSSERTNNSVGPDQTVNVDELEVQILIIAKNQSSVKSAAQFLTRRGWPAKVVTDLGKAIQTVVSEKPDLVLLSINHPNPKITKLPAILSQGMNANSVLFAESMDARSQAVLANSKSFKITGSPSGPNLHRGIRKILNDIYNPETESSSQRSDSLTGSESDVTRISGSGQEGNGDSDIYNSSGPKTETESLQTGNYTMEREKPRRKLRDLDVERPGSKGPSMYMAKGEKGREGPSAADLMKLLQASDESDGPHIQSPETSSAENSVIMPSDENSAETASAQASQSHMAADSAVQEGQGSGSPFSLQQQGLSLPQAEMDLNEQSAKEASSAQLQKGPDALKHNELQQAPSQAQNTKMNPQNCESSSSNLGQASLAGPKALQIQESVGKKQSGKISSEDLSPSQDVKTAIKESLKAVFTAASKFPDRKQDIAGNVGSLGVLLMSSEEYQGFIAFGFSGMNEPQSLMDEFKEKFISALKEKKISMEVEIGFVMDVNRFSFTDWVNNEADYALDLELESLNLQAGVFAYTQDIRNRIANYNQEMLTIDVNLLDPDHDVPFKAYLHLKKNGKFYKYLNQGRKILDKQKEKLEAKNADVRISREDLPSLKMYCARLEIKTRIKPFENLSESFPEQVAS